MSLTLDDDDDFGEEYVHINNRIILSSEFNNRHTMLSYVKRTKCDDVR